MFKRKLVLRVSLMLIAILFVSCASTHQSQVISELSVQTTSSLKADVEVDREV